MLVLSRKKGERMCVGEDVVITVLEVNGSQVKLGVDAPQSEVVCREEVLRSQARLPAGRFRARHRP